MPLDCSAGAVCFPPAAFVLAPWPQQSPGPLAMPGECGFHCVHDTTFTPAKACSGSSTMSRQALHGFSLCICNNLFVGPQPHLLGAGKLRIAQLLYRRLPVGVG